MNLRWIRLPLARYRARHFRRRERFRKDYGILADSLMRRLDFGTVLDIGCANGFLLSSFVAAGKRVGGIELSRSALQVLPPEVAPLVTIGDFSVATGEWDLVCCVEMAEHVAPGRSEELVTTVARVARKQIYFTAAPPGQSGRGHVNCREHDEWLRWFRASGWALQEVQTKGLKNDLKDLTEAAWLRQNSMILAPQ